MVQNSQQRNTLIRGVIYSVLVLMALYYLVPFLVMLMTSFKSMADIRSGSLLSLPTSIDLSAWFRAWDSACASIACEGVKPYFFNSIKIVVPAVVISTAIGALNGYIFSHWKFKGSDIFFTALLVGCFIPFQIIILPMAQLLGKVGLSNSYWGLVLVHVIYGVAGTTLFFRNYYTNVPSELVNAAKVDGAHFFSIFFKILLPLSGPIITVTVIWQFTQIWNDFLFGVIFSSADTQPITVALNNLVNVSMGEKEYNVHMAAAIIAAIPTLLVYILAGKYFVRGLTAGSVKG
ncbi:MAG TPA: carbohydrate ABC transporter permease [Oligoflexia bacterium]|nr:carbohydrate ABC transporter permease [Oligoflexia bacterium]HMR24930.1 carbohydrate ABC transporter permease [Oligoflexia bacterium]